jgi:diamine N-acetyltransferase
MSARYRPVDKDNWHALTKLKVRDDQTHFVAPNVYSIAQSQFGFEMDGGRWNFHPFGMFEDETPVGFFMYALNFDGKQFQAFIVRLMVDAAHQGKGYGRFGMETMIEAFWGMEQVKEVAISYEPENDAARKLYASCGFVETGEMMGDEVQAVLKLR